MTTESDPQGLSDTRPIDLGETPPPPKAPDPYVGKTIDGRYVIEAVLGQGGMGVVYKGKHKLIDKKVAIKVLRGDLARDSEVTERFLQEARAASAIGNPHIVDISDFGVLPDGATYFVMEFLDGKSLTGALEEQRPMPIQRLVPVAKQIAKGLSAAHVAGIVHRDLKPDNVMLINRGGEKDFVKVLDFGIAKVGGEASRLTRAGSVFGTPHYMSPEQAAGATVNHATDIYSLGVILYEMAAGKVPFDAENFMGILTMHMYKAPVPIRALVPPPPGEIPAGLDAIVLKCLSKKPEARYASMDALVADFEKLEKGIVPDAVGEMMARSGGFNVPTDYFQRGQMPAPVPASPPGFSRRKWPLIAGVAGVATAIGIVIAIFVRSATSGADTAKPDTTASAAPTSTVKTLTPNDLPPVELHAIAVAVDPTDAKVLIDGKEQKSPVMLKLKTGESMSMTVSRQGFQTQTVTVAYNEESKLVRLVPIPGQRPVNVPTAKPSATTTATAKPTATTKPTATGFGDMNDPWKK